MAKRIRRFFLMFATALVLAFCGIFAACGDGEGLGGLGGLGGGQEQQQPLTAVNQDSIKYDGRLITWTAVSGAEKYTVTINNGNEYSSPTNQFSYSVAATEERVEISIKAVRGEEITDATVKLFTRLPKIEAENIYFDETGKMTWDAVIGATEYAIRINGVETRSYALEFSDFKYGERNSISIMPVGPADSTFSEWSTSISKDYLGAPSNIQYDGQFITFTGNNFASKYMIYINGSAYQETASTVFEFDASRASFDVQVQSVGDGKNSFNSSLSESKTFIHLADITGFRVEDGILSWNAVPEASGYKVRLNGAEMDVTDNFVSDLPAGRENKIQVKPVTTEGEAYFANWSEEQTVRLLVAPTLMWQTGISIDEYTMNALYWDKVDGDVGGYNVRVIYPDKTKEIFPLGADDVQFGHDFAETGTYEISIQTSPVADSNSYQSAFSAPVRVIRLATPNQVQNFIVSNPTRVSQGFTMNWQSVSGATGYQIWKDGEKLNGTTLTTTTNIPYNQIMESDDTEAKTFQYQIQALGSDKTFATERYVTLNSLKKDMLTATIKVLAQPQEVKFEGYTVSWKEVPSAKGYAVNCTGEATVKNTQYDLANLEAGVYNDFGICAMGNGGDLLASNYTPSKKLVRLAAPFDIQLRADSDGDTLTWNTSNSNADHYAVFWNDEPETAVRADQIGDIGQYITTQTRGLFMRAMANYEDVATGIYFITSEPSDTVTFTKLDAVTFNNVKVRGNKFIWNEPKNVAGVTIKYRVYKNNGMSLDGEVVACEYDISGFGAGTYDLRVRAIGGGHFVSSELSEAVSFTKLATPEVTTPENSTSMTWPEVAGEVDQYIVEIDGEIVESIKPGTNHEDGKYTYVEGVYTYKYQYATIKPNGYAVRVYAQGDGMDTVDSNAWTRTQNVAAANMPGYEISYCNASGQKIEFNEANAQFVITIRNIASCYTTGYEVEIGKTSGYVEKADGETTVFTYKPDQTGTFQARVYAVGGVYGADGTYYVRSETEAVREMTVHAAPTNVELTSSAIKWKAVTGAGSYLVKYFADGQWTEKTVNGSMLTITSTVANKITKIEVYALGNGYDTVGSVAATKNIT